jgi:hypothetical protein
MNPKRLQERRAFKEQLLARLKLVATERGIPDADMKWLGRLYHEDLVVFVQKHGLSWDWVLCGDLKGRLRQARKLPFQVIQGGRQ